MLGQWNDKIFNVTNAGFNQLALEIFHFQYLHNQLYKTYADMMGVQPRKLTELSQIPFLPLDFFKTHAVKTTEFEPQAVFESSGTSKTVNSHHLIKDIEIYQQSFLRGFELFYESLTDWCVIGLLPSYLERKNSSLVFMVNEFIRRSRHPQSGFYLEEFEKLQSTLNELEEKKQKTLLIGVSFALLDFAERYPVTLKHTIIMETGGMKGRREEMVREELHEVLSKAFSVDQIHSEYGMTELLSQAYSKGKGIFQCPPWMKVLVRDEEDPLLVRSQESGVGSRESGVRSYESGVRSQKYEEEESATLPTPDSRLPTQRGVINIVDLANIYSCSFIATDDAGKLYADGSFEVLGRVDNSDIRGCSLMVV